jgi:hypothetical protein
LRSGTWAICVALARIQANAPPVDDRALHRDVVTAWATSQSRRTNPFRLNAQKQRNDAKRKGQIGRQQIFDGLLTRRMSRRPADVGPGGW